MPVNTSIYQTQQPMQMPSVADSMQKAMALSNMGMQNQQEQYQLAGQQAMRQAFQKNVGPDGQIDRGGVLSDLASSGYGQKAIELGQSFNAMDKANAERQQQQMASVHAQATATVPVYKYLLGMKDDQAQQAYPQMVKNLADNGVNVANLPPAWNRDAIQRGFDVASQYKEQLENQLTQAKTMESQQQAGMVGVGKGADELQKFNEDINNASSRKETGALMQTRDRADRLINLSNSGAPANETQDQKIDRLNKTLPQLANEYSVGLAAILQGGVPSDTLMKETGLDTVGSRIASLQQQWNAKPTAGNQGALINAYVEAAQKMRDFSAGRLADVANRARSAYPFANKYFGSQMDKIAAPITSSNYGSQTSGAALANKSSGAQGGGLIPSASASDSAPKLPALPQGMIRIKGPDGKTYRIPVSQKGEAIAAGGSVVQ